MFLDMILEEKKGKMICTMKEVVIPPLVTTVVTGMADTNNTFKIFECCC